LVNTVSAVDHNKAGQNLPKRSIKSGKAMVNLSLLIIFQGCRHPARNLTREAFRIVEGKSVELKDMEGKR
jgi:hypothetical protein